MTRLELGSGYTPYRTDDPEWEHLDGNPNAPHVEYLLDLAGPLPFADETFDELRAVDCLEHVSYRDTDKVLREWARVLRPGGTIYIQVPAADVMMARYLQNPTSLITDEFREYPPVVSLAWRLMGGQADGDYSKPGDDWRLNAHYALFTDLSLRWYLDRAGLLIEELTINPFPNLCCTARKQ